MITLTRRPCHQTVFFDCGHTFLSPCKSVGEIYAMLSKEKGYILSSETINSKISTAWKNYLYRKKLRHFECTNSTLIHDWKEFVREVLPDHIPADKFDDLFVHIYTRFGDPQFYTLANGFKETIQKLKKLQVQTGIISNWDNRLPGLLKGFNLYSLFDTLTVSYETGIEKPNKKIYELACRRAGVRPESALMIGDAVNEDVKAAQSAGMTGILYDPKVSEPGWPGPVIHSWTKPDALFEFLNKET